MVYYVVYGVSKYGVFGFIRVVVKENGGWEICINVVVFGVIYMFMM